MLNYHKMFAGIEKSRASALLDMRKRKDWVNSALYHNYVLMEQENGPLDTISSIADNASPKKKDKTILTSSEAEYLSKLFC